MLMADDYINKDDSFIGTKVEVATKICFSKATAAHYCSKCMYVVHAICGEADGEEGYGKPVVCNHCLKF